MAHARLDFNGPRHNFARLSPPAHVQGLARSTGGIFPLLVVLYLKCTIAEGLQTHRDRNQNDHGVLQKSYPLPPHLPLRCIRRIGWQPVRIHGVRKDGVDHQGRDGLHHQRPPLRRVWRGGGRDRPRGLGRADAGRVQLLRAGKPRHLQRPRPLPRRPHLRTQPHLRWIRPTPRLVLQLRGGHRHGPPRPLLPAAIHDRAVARAGHRPLRPHRHPELLPRRRCGEELGSDKDRIQCGIRRGMTGILVIIRLYRDMVWIFEYPYLR